MLVTPHVGGDSSAFTPRAVALVAEQLRRFLVGEPLLHRVEPPQPRDRAGLIGATGSHWLKRSPRGTDPVT